MVAGARNSTKKYPDVKDDVVVDDKEDDLTIIPTANRVLRGGVILLSLFKHTLGVSRRWCSDEPEHQLRFSSGQDCTDGLFFNAIKMIRRAKVRRALPALPAANIDRRAMPALQVASHLLDMYGLSKKCRSATNVGLAW